MYLYTRVLWGLSWRLWWNGMDRDWEKLANDAIEMQMYWKAKCRKYEKALKLIYDKAEEASPTSGNKIMKLSHDALISEE